MRYLVLLCVLLAAYWYFVRSKPNAHPTPAAADAPTPSAQAAHTPAQSSIVKRPFDRTKEALGATKKRDSDGF